MEGKTGRIKILFLEDLQSDLELAKRELDKEGILYDFRVVETEKAFLNQLELFCPNIIISDYAMPAFDGMSALKLTRQKHPALPFIILTGSMNEETAVECMKAGANDYVIKEQITRLPFAVSDAIKNRIVQNEKAEFERQLRESEANLKAIIENTIDNIWSVNTNYEIQYVNNIFIRNFEKAYNVTLCKGMNVLDLISEPERGKWKRLYDRALSGEQFMFTDTVSLNDNTVYIEISMSPIIFDEQIVGTSVYARDITSRKEQELALLTSEQKFRTLFQNHSAVKLIIDTENGNILEANTAAAEFYGWSVEKLQSMKISDLNSLSDDEIVEQMRLVRLKIKNHFEFKHRVAKGGIKDVEVFTSKVDFNGKEVLHSIVHDISERKKAEQQLLLLSKAVEQNPVVIIIADREGNIEYVNPAFTKITGYTLEQVLGKNPKILSSGEHTKEFYAGLWGTILSGNDWSGEFKNRKANGELYWEEAIISPIVNDKGEISHFVAVKEDVTEKRKIIDDLVQAKEKAEESDRLKTAFLANMSHEIRTPMSGIIGFVDLLSQPMLSGAEQELYVKIIQRSSQRMLSTLNDIIEISKIESGQIDLSFSQLDVAQEVEDLCLFFRKEASEKGIQLHNKSAIVKGLQLTTDRGKFDSILSNLIKNAIKYTDSGGVEVNFEVKDGNVVFGVKDTGIGIPAHRIPAIFNRFEQADIADVRAMQGSGLGLSIAKSYCEMLGGSIWAESEDGLGSQFYFSLPAAFTSKNKETMNSNVFQESNPPSESKKLKILIAEDEHSSDLFLSIVLEKYAKEILHTKNGKEAVEICRKNADIDLVLMDIKMPTMSGYDATKRIRQFNRDLIIVAQTAFAISGDEEKALAAGCNAYLSKPIRKDDLLSLITKLFPGLKQD